MKRLLYITALMLLFLPELQATHLIGGNLGYEYLGQQPNGMYRYRILLTTFTDCSPSSEIPYPENPLTIGIYEHSLQSPQNDKQRIDSLVINLIETETYTPDLPPGCPVGQNTCIIRGSYEAIIDLPASTNGYHIFYERCCRNVGIINLQPNQSASFHAYIPPTNIVNSSPVFLSSPIPFICVNDPTTILNDAFDPDGDSLVYVFSTAYNGFGDMFNTQPALPAPDLNWPIPEVVFVPGFDEINPFGSSGSAVMDLYTGLAEYTIPIPGPYVICVEVREYRNGQLIGTIRRDLQLLALPCPFNPEPELAGNLQTIYETEVGDTLCFPVTFADPNQDSVFLTYSGKVFDSTLFNPIASFQITQIDSNAATGDFCWVIPCHADTGEFDFMIRADDNGCPPKVNYEPYKLIIHGPQPPEIIGPDTVCETTDSVLYTVNSRPGYQFSWQVVNGTIVQSYGDSIVVSWGTGTTGQISVVGANRFGCFAGYDTLDITLIQVPVLTAMPDDTICTGDTIQLTATGSVSPWYWYPPGDLVDPLVPDPFTIVTTSQWYYVAGLPDYRCPASDSVYISVLPLPEPNATNDTSLCRNDTLQLSAFNGISYVWTPGNLVSDPLIADPYTVVESDMVLWVTVTDTNGCRNTDTVQVGMFELPSLEMDDNPTLCAGDTIQLSVSGGAEYQWTPPDYLSADNISNPLAFPPTTQVYDILVTDSNQCQADTNLTVTVSPVPLADFEAIPVSASCDGFIFEMDNLSSGATSYAWDFGDGTTSDEFEPVHIYPFGQEYIIQLTAYNDQQCDASATDTISINDLMSFINFKKVNVFSPNGDGINDVLDFSLPIEFETCTHVYIYNRWGLLVYENTSSQPSWDGTSTTNANIPEGVYFWIIEVNGVQFNGNVSLMR